VSVAVIEAGVAAAALTLAAADYIAIARANTGAGGRMERLAVAARRLAPGLVTQARMRERAAAAGMPRAGEDLLALKAALGVGCGLVALPLTGTIGGRTGVVVIMALAAGGFFAPDLVLARRIAARRSQIALELPALLDLLSVTVRAGLPVSAALEQVALRHGGLLGAELRSVDRAVQAGATRTDALNELRGRCPHAGVAAMVAAIGRADRHGASLGPALTAIATDAREDRARAIREHAARAAPQIQLVIALGLVPATMLIVAAGLLATL
jgi:tight adherence protein C